MKFETITFIIVISAFIIGGLAIGKMMTEDITGNVIGDGNDGGDDNANSGSGNVVLLKTNHGDIKIELYDNMPITAGNFKKLVEDGVYDGVIFHRIIDGFMLQGGDPTGTGMGDPSIPKIQDEFTNTDSDKNDRGTISMANAGPNTGSSQFFINLVNNNFLDGKHPVFGKVVEGMDVVDKIAKVQVGAQDRPVGDVIIEKAELI